MYVYVYLSIYVCIYIYIYLGRSKFDLNCPLILLLKVIMNSHWAYDTTIHLDAKFQFLVICCSRLYPKETIKVFFGSGHNWAHFRGFGGSASSKERQIEMMFWPQVVLIVVQMLLKAFWKNRIVTETGRSQSLNFWSNFDHSLPPEDGENKKGRCLMDKIRSAWRNLFVDSPEKVTA